MDVQLQELIDKIKKDGIASAEEAAKQIINEAEKKASSIILEAEQKADSVLKNAKAETERMEKASEDAIAQAARNMILSFRDSIVEELDRLIQKNVESSYSKEVIANLIPETVKAWTKNADASSLSILLSEKDLNALEQSLINSLKEEIAKGLELKTDKTISAGFRVGIKDGRAFYDYSSESLAELFSAYINPKTASILKGAVQGTIV